jgi:hypothetical protein
MMVGDLQEYICNSPDDFFGEVGQRLFLVGKEVKPSDTVQDRIDLLAVDEEGRAVIVELKRGNNKLHLLQAISYAGMVANWEADDFLRLLDAKRREELTDRFLKIADTDDINREQRIVLIAEEYDYSVLVSAEWLSEKFGVDITCCRIALAEDLPTKSRFLVCNVVFPTPELAGQAKRRGPGPTPPGKWADWKTALADIANTAMVAYINKQIEEGRECNLRKRSLMFRLAGKRRWFVSTRKDYVYVWQRGRFNGDVEFWKERLSQSNDVQPVKDETCLRFYLSSEGDFTSFHDAATDNLQSVQWLDGMVDGEDELDAKEDGQVDLLPS